MKKFVAQYEASLGARRPASEKRSAGAARKKKTAKQTTKNAAKKAVRKAAKKGATRRKR